MSRPHTGEFGRSQQLLSLAPLHFCDNRVVFNGAAYHQKIRDMQVFVQDITGSRIDNAGRYINTTPGASAMVRNGRSDLDAFRTLQARLRALPDAPRDVQAN